MSLRDINKIKEIYAVKSADFYTKQQKNSCNYRIFVIRSILFKSTSLKKQKNDRNFNNDFNIAIRINNT